MNGPASSAGLSGAFATLAESLETAVATPGIDDASRHVLARRVAALLDDRAGFLVGYRGTWDEAAVRDYAASRRHDGGERTSPHVETMHLHALERLALLEGAETPGHVARVADCTRVLATARGESQAASATLGLAARIHDVGLAAVPEELFLNRSRVDSYETQLVETHTRVGAALLDALVAWLGVVEGPLAVARDIVLCHHERHDGLGPHGLAGEAIPPAARLVALADVYDTLRRNRPSREGLDHAAAVVAIRSSNRGGQARFDPELLPVFIACTGEIGAIYDHHGEIV